MSVFSNFINKFTGRTTRVWGTGNSSVYRSREIEDSEICTGILDCNATHIARGKVLHVVEDVDGRIKQIKRTSEYTRLFERPNPIMNHHDFMYAMAWQLQVMNTAYAWIKWDKRMHPVEIWPLVYLSFELHKRTDGGFAVKITDTTGEQFLVRTEDLIVLRRKYDGTGFAGRGNGEIRETIGMVNSVDEGLKQALNVSNKIHGILTNKKTMLANEDKHGDETMARLENAAKNGGILTLDSMESYQPLDPKTWSANAVQSKQIVDRLYNYWRTPESVVNNTATESIMQNYYESLVEPIWEIMSSEFTNALFTRKEQGFGNKILVTSSAANSASWQTKLNIIQESKEVGLLMVNELRELIGYGPLEDGDVRLVSLNYVKSTDQSKYQTGKEDNNGEGNGQDSSKD